MNRSPGRDDARALPAVDRSWWRRALATGFLGAGLYAGLGLAADTARADEPPPDAPVEQTTEDPAATQQDETGSEAYATAPSEEPESTAARSTSTSATSSSTSSTSSASTSPTPAGATSTSTESTSSSFTSTMSTSTMSTSTASTVTKQTSTASTTAGSTSTESTSTQFTSTHSTSTSTSSSQTSGESTSTSITTTDTTAGTVAADRTADTTSATTTRTTTTAPATTTGAMAKPDGVGDETCARTSPGIADTAGQPAAQRPCTDAALPEGTQAKDGVAPTVSTAERAAVPSDETLGSVPSSTAPTASAGAPSAGAAPGPALAPPGQTPVEPLVPIPPRSFPAPAAPAAASAPSGCGQSAGQSGGLAGGPAMAAVLGIDTDLTPAIGAGSSTPFVVSIGGPAADPGTRPD